MHKTTAEQGIEMRKKILEFVIDYIKDKGYSPSGREIADGVGLKSTSSVHNHLMMMFGEGTLESDIPGGARAIRVPGYKFIKEQKQ